jgi:hypothetical protein
MLLAKRRSVVQKTTAHLAQGNAVRNNFLEKPQNSPCLAKDSRNGITAAQRELSEKNRRDYQAF